MRFLLITILTMISCLVSSLAFAEWKVDFSRRQQDLIRRELEKRKIDEEPTIKKVFEVEKPKEEIVILNTAQGFVPKKLKLKVDQLYKVSVVNVNKDKKNVSFMLDAFAEHHGTYFGDVVEFTVRPKKPGLYPFFSPEVETSGQVLVYQDIQPIDEVPAIKIRQPASSQRAIKHNIIRSGDGKL